MFATQDVPISAQYVPLSPYAPLSKKDWTVAALLVIATMIFVAGHLHRPILPMEDASMLLRYSQNFARGNGIVWNVGEHPVEGATDFLYMLLIGVVSRVTKASVKTVAETILFVSHAAGVLLLYVGLRRLYRAPLLLAAGFSILLGAGVGYHYVDTAFSAPFYALFALATWYVGTVCIQTGVSWRRAILFGTLGFITGLIRPDGVILAGFMLCSTLFGVQTGWAERRRLIVCFVGIFAVFGGAYFAWRLHYFGYPFPNPFYIKRTGGPQPILLKLSTRGVVEMLLPVLPFVAFALRSRAALRQMAVWLITVVPFTAVWMFISGDNNHFSRFQYVMVPLSILAIGGFAAEWWREQEMSSADGWRAKALSIPLGGVFVGMVACGVYYNMHLYVMRPAFSNRGAQDLAARLKPYASKNYTMVMTEAGDLPFYSEWRAVDAEGLNDAYVAHHNWELSEAYLDSYHPEIIMYRVWGEYVSVPEFRAQLGQGDVSSTDVLTRVDSKLSHYAKERGYVLAAVLGGKHCLADTYWVRSDFADRDAIVSAIRDHPYYTQEYGLLADDFKDVPAPSEPCLAP
jgi:arabinofuranosyltransferase